MRYDPVFLNLTGKPSIAIEDGTIAEGKTTGLLEANAKVVALALEVIA
jgi:siroheme synthase (precorrin-2 oxidase/ferrochelatase)